MNTPVPTVEQAILALLRGDNRPADALLADVRRVEAESNGRVEIDNADYENTHGKAPRGRGSWGFTNAAGDVEFAPDGKTLTEAKAWAKANLPAGRWSVAG